jgi:aconitase B
MMLKTFLFLSAAALGATAAAAGESANRTGQPDLNRMICRTINDTGDKLRRQRVCHTAAEWKELRRQTQETIEHIQNSRAANGG